MRMWLRACKVYLHVCVYYTVDSISVCLRVWGALERCARMLQPDSAQVGSLCKLHSLVSPSLVLPWPIYRVILLVLVHWMFGPSVSLGGPTEQTIPCLNANRDRSCVRMISKISTVETRVSLWPSVPGLTGTRISLVVSREIHAKLH